MPIIFDLSGATITYSTLVNDVMLHVPQCPVWEVEDQLRLAAREFCRTSNVWRSRNLLLLTTVASQDLYAFSAPADAALNDVHSAWNGSTELDVARPGDTDDYEPGSSDSTWKVGAEDEATIRLSPAPDASGIEVKGSVSYLPSVTSTAFPRWIYDRWRKQIASGAIAMLVVQPAKPWTNPGMAPGHMAFFNDGVMEASNFAGPVRRKGLRAKAV